MNIQNFIVALIALLASLQGSTYEQTSSQVVDILGGRNGVPVDVVDVVEAGNGVNHTFDNTSLPLTIPNSWGDTSLAIVVGGTNGGALRGRTGLASKTGVISRIDWMVTDSAMADGTFISLNVGKAISNLAFYHGDAPIAFYVDLINQGGTLKTRIRYPTSKGEVISTWSGTVTVGTVFQTYVQYNLIQGFLEFKVDGETVVNHTLDGSAVQSIDTLVVGSSGGSTGRNIGILADRILEHVLPYQGVAPTNVTVATPAAGATNVEISSTVTCAGTNANSWEVRVETVNPPVGAYVSTGERGVYGPTLATGTTYYAQCRATNTNGTTESAVSSFTTITPVSTSGDHPVLLRTAARDTTWVAMKADYDGSKSTPKCTDSSYTTNQKVGCDLYKSNLDASNAGSAFGTTNYGLEDAWLAQIDGNDAALYCGRAFSRASDGANGILQFPTVNDIYWDDDREFFTDWVIIYDWCYNDWTQPQRDAYLTRLNELATLRVSEGRQMFWCGNVDQQIGDYFGTANLYYATRAYNQTIVDLWEGDANLYGGLTATALKCYPQNDPARTVRNMIKYYYETAAAGGAWHEGSMYAGTAFLGVIGCEALKTTDAGSTACTEIDAYVPEWAEYLTHALTRDSKYMMQMGDEQDPHEAFLPRFSHANTTAYLSLTGLLSAGSTREHLWKTYLNMRATNGGVLINGLPIAMPFWRARSTILTNPYITAAADLSALPKCFPSDGYGVYIWNDGTLTTDAQFFVHFPPDRRTYDHSQHFWGNPQMYRRGQFVLTHPFSYAGYSGWPEGTNTSLVEGMSPKYDHPFDTAKQFKETVGYTCGSDYLYVEGTTGGAKYPQKSIDGVNQFFVTTVFNHEWSKAFVYLPSATNTYSTTVTVERINVQDPETLARFTNYTNNSCYPGCADYLHTGDEERIQGNPAWTRFQFQWANPTIAANVTSWTMPDGQLVTNTWLSPDDVTIVEQDLSANTTVGFNDLTTKPSERKYRTITTPKTATQMNVLVDVFDARNAGTTAPVITELTVTGNCGAVLISRTGNDDRVVVWNTAAGSNITPDLPTEAQATAVLQTARYRPAGSCTVPYTQTTASAKMLIMHLNPALGWTANINGAGANALTEDSSGFEELAISTAGSKSVVIAGS